MEAPGAGDAPALPWARPLTPEALKQEQRNTEAAEARASSARQAGEEESPASKRARLEATATAAAFRSTTAELQAGDMIEVLWELEEDGHVSYKWWKAVVVGPARPCPESSSPTFTVRYEAYKDIEQADEIVQILAPGQLQQLGGDHLMKWRRVGDTSIPTESEAEDGRDGTVTLQDLEEDGEWLERSMGASIEDAAMQHLQENLPMDGQLRVAAGFRHFSDFIKQQLQQRQAAQGSDYVVTGDDITNMLQNFRNAS